MKRAITIILLLSTTSAFSFDYQQYAKHYLDSVNGLRVGNGICIDLINDLIFKTEDSMLIDHSHYGIPIPLEESKTGDVVRFNNHICLIYSNENGLIHFADQNRIVLKNGIKTQEKFVAIRTLDSRHINASNFVVYRPINLCELSLFKSGGENKKTLINLYSLDLNDSLDQARTKFKYGININAGLGRNNIVDTTIVIREIDLYLARNFSKTYTHNGVSFVKTPLGRLFVKKDLNLNTACSKWHAVGWEQNKSL